jgi:hypothetical protein
MRRILSQCDSPEKFALEFRLRSLPLAPRRLLSMRRFFVAYADFFEATGGLVLVRSQYARNFVNCRIVYPIIAID